MSDLQITFSYTSLLYFFFVLRGKDLPQVGHTSFTLSRTKEFFRSPGSGGIVVLFLMLKGVGEGVWFWEI